MGKLRFRCCRIAAKMWGILDGYNYAAAHYKVHQLGMTDMLFINSDAEVADMMNACHWWR